MIIQNNNSTNFQARISPKMESMLKKQAEYYPNSDKIKLLLEKQFSNVTDWGNERIEIVICKNIMGKYTLGICIPVRDNIKVKWPIKNLKGKTELTKFLAVTSQHIKETQISIEYLVQKYGLNIFKKTE